MKEITVNWSKSDAGLMREKAFKILEDLKNVIKLELYPDFIITIHASRKDYNKALNKQSESWEVGSATYGGNIHILHPAAFEKYSTHDKSEFDSVLKHEMVHILLRALANNSYIPHWLNEGLANYISAQESECNSSPYYIEQSFTSKLSSQRDWNSFVNDGAYTISREFIKYLAERYSLEKVLELVRSLDKNFYEPRFKEKFKQQIGVDLSQAETEFAMNSR